MKREVAKVAEPVESFERQDSGLQCMRNAAVHMGSEGKAKPGWHTSAYILNFNLLLPRQVWSQRLSHVHPHSCVKSGQIDAIERACFVRGPHHHHCHTALLPVHSHRGIRTPLSRRIWKAGAWHHGIQIWAHISGGGHRLGVHFPTSVLILVTESWVTTHWVWLTL